MNDRGDRSACDQPHSGCGGVSHCHCGGGYVLTKSAEREAEWRKEKLAYYKEFVSSVSGTIANEYSLEGQKRFSRACNDILSSHRIGSLPHWIGCCEEIRTFNLSKNLERYDRSLSELFLEIRREIGVRPRDKRRINPICVRPVPRGENAGA